MSELARVVQVAAASRNGTPQLAAVDRDQAPADPLTQLSGLLGLPAVGLQLVSVDLFGFGSNAIAHLHLDNGRRIELEPLGKFGSPSKLTIELAIQVGATPTLKAPLVATAMALIHRVAKHHEAVSKSALIADWGMDFLQAAQVHHVDMAHQEDRWCAFELLHHTDPVSRARMEGTSIASQSIVLEDPNGVRYVRCGWFLSYVRAAVGPYSSQDLARDMQSVGWQRPGGEGRIKATPAGLGKPHVWTFYLVPDGWGADA